MDPTHTYDESEAPVPGRGLTIAATLAGVGYLAWRALTTLDGVPIVLAWPALVVEALGVLGVTVLLLALRRPPPRTDRLRPATLPADVIVRVEAEPLGRLLATLAGLRHATNVASTTILTFADRDDVRALAAEHGIDVHAVDPERDATGLKLAQRIGRSPFLVVLDAGDVPMPEVCDVLVRHAYDGRVAGVRGAVDSWTTDSAEHDARGRHLLRFERDALYPASGRAAPLQGSGVLVRRWALDHVGVPDGPRRTVELRLAARLRAAGLDVVAPAEPVLVSACSANTASAVALERRRDTAAALTLLASKDGPLRSGGLGVRDRVAVLAACVRPLSGLRRALFLTILLGSLLLGRLPFDADVAVFAACWTPWFVLQALALHRASRGTLSIGDRARWSFATMGPAVAALYGPGDPIIGAGRMRPRVGALREMTANRPLVAALAAFAIVLPLVAVSDRVTGWLPAMDTVERTILLGVGVWVIAVMLDVLRCLNGTRQLRRSARVPTEIPGAVDGGGATIIDVTPYGVGVVVDEPIEPGDEVIVQFEVPGSLDGVGRSPIAARGLVRRVRISAAGFVCGIEFLAMDRASSDALYEYCEVVHSHGWFRAQRATRAQRRATALVPPVALPARRVGVRLTAVVALLGVAVASVPPFRGTDAASDEAPRTLTVRVVDDRDQDGARDSGGASPLLGPTDGLDGVTLVATCTTDPVDPVDPADAASAGGVSAARSAGVAAGSTTVTARDTGAGIHVFDELPAGDCRIEATALPLGVVPAPLGPDNGGLLRFVDTRGGSGLELTMAVHRGLPPCTDADTAASETGSSETGSSDTGTGAAGAATAGTSTPATSTPATSTPAPTAVRAADCAPLDGATPAGTAPTELAHRAWADLDGDGEQDPGEPPLAGVPVTLVFDAAAGPDAEITVVTDADGVARFTSDERPEGTPSVATGVAELVEGAAAVVRFPTSVTVDGIAWPLTVPDAVAASDTIDADAAEDTGEIPVTVGAPGAHEHGLDVGYASRHSIGDLVWDDRDNDGTFQVGEPGIADVTVRLHRDADGNGIPDGEALATVVTGPEGHYRFTGLAAGTYVVEAVTPVGFRSSTGLVGSASGPYEGPDAPDPDLVPVDGDDQGIATDDAGALVRTRPVTLGSAEPTGEPATPGHPDPTPDTRTDATVDLGFFRPLSVGNLVWEDLDDSGTADDGEPGIPGVTVLLRRGGEAGEIVSFTTTDRDGRYVFPLLSAGRYELEVVPPPGYRTSTGGDTEPATSVDGDLDDGDDNGTFAEGALRSAPFDLTPGTEPTDDADDLPAGVRDPAADEDANHTVDVGLRRPVSIGDLVWNDLDDDGVAETGEPGLAGVPVALFTADGATEVPVGPDGVLGTADDAEGGVLTDATGAYSFTDLVPGTYRVRVDVPAGWRTSTAADAGDANDDTDDDSNAAARATGQVLLGHVELVVATEPVDDGDADAGTNRSVDVGLFQPTPSMVLQSFVAGCDADAPAPSAATDPSGGCPPGDPASAPVVATGAPARWTHVVRNTGNVALVDVRLATSPVAPSSGAAGAAGTAGAPGEIDCNGAADGSGLPASVPVGGSLTCHATAIVAARSRHDRTTLTADAEATPGAVTALEPVTDDTRLVGGDPGLAVQAVTLLADPGPLVDGVLSGAPVITGTDDADVPGGSDMTANHAVPDGTTVWWAVAVSNTGDDPLVGVRVVDQRRGLVCDGLGLAPGDTRWCAVAGRLDAASTTDGQYATVATATGVVDPTAPAPHAGRAVGPVHDPTHAFVAIPAITVESSTNRSAADTPDERPLVDAGSGVVWRHVVTNTGNWPIESVVVADDLEGSISCPVLPGEPSRLLPGQSVTCSLSGVARPLLGGVDHASTATVTATPLPPSTGTLASVADDDPTGHRVAVASIGDLVWSDTDVDGVQDPDEPGVPAVAVRLLDVDGLVVATTTTDATGRYRFDQLDPGTYQLEIVPPVDHFVTGAGRVFDDSVDSDVDPATRRTPLTRLDGGETDTGWDVGLYRLASIGDRVWFDGDRDGVQDAGESAAVGTVVRLLTASGASLASTTTDVAGAYRFADLRPGAFVVQMDAPDGYAPTTSDVVSDAVSPAAGDAPADPDAVDSDVSPVTGQSAVVVLVSGADERSVDVGIVEQASVGGRVWIGTDVTLDPADVAGPGATDAAASGTAAAGVVVLLLGPDGAAIDRTRTDADGRYTFAGLDPGTYTVALGSTASASGPVQVELAAGAAESAVDLALVPAADAPEGAPVSPDATGGSVVAAAAPSGDPTVVAGLPLTGGNVLQLVVFAAAVLLAGLLLLRARRPAGL